MRKLIQVLCCAMAVLWAVTEAADGSIARRAENPTNQHPGVAVVHAPALASRCVTAADGACLTLGCEDGLERLQLQAKGSAEVLTTSVPSVRGAIACSNHVAVRGVTLIQEASPVAVPLLHGAMPRLVAIAPVSSLAHDLLVAAALANPAGVAVRCRSPALGARLHHLGLDDNPRSTAGGVI